jgi:high affinity Mn2+ porin
VEVYYLLLILRWVGLTVDYQFIADPGDNRARGPVSVVSLRLHVEAAYAGVLGHL